MKYLLIAALLTTGCTTNYKMEGVNEQFPDAEVVFTPNQSHDFVVRTKDGSVWYVRSDNPFSNKVTSKSLLLKPMK